MIRLAIICPCYNEESVLPLSAPRLDALLDSLVGSGRVSADSFVLLVNDGSRDRTWEIISELCASSSRFSGLNLAGNVGHQNAIMAGMMTARPLCEALVTIDADLQDDLDALVEMVDRHAEGYDIVYGVKVSRTADPVMKRTLAVTFYRLQEAMGIQAVYNHADFRLLSRRAVDALSQYSESNLYLRGLIPRLGFRSTTVDDVISERAAGESKYNLSRMLMLAVDGITSFSTRPLLWITGLGFVSLGVSLLMGGYILCSLLGGSAVAGWTSIMASLWLLGSLLLLSVGIVGQYIGKIYTEVKRRPLYHVERFVPPGHTSSSEADTRQEE